jgi:uncharacterized YigZ family protein
MKIIYENGTGEIEEKKSRFIAGAYHVETEEEAAEIINKVKKQYWDARHNCYAYILGGKKQIMRFSDDGEPQGTAGKPILDIIDKMDLYDCLVVVTRYFGGTLLGTGGLIRAYQAAAKEGIANSTVLELSQGIQAAFDVDYNSIGKLQYICNEMGIDITDTQYTENVHMEVVVENDIYASFVQKITDAFSGKTEIVEIGQCSFGRDEKNAVVLL